MKLSVVHVAGIKKKEHSSLNCYYPRQIEKRKLSEFIFLFLFLLPFSSLAQTNIICTNPIAEQVMAGNYDPAAYHLSLFSDDPNVISQGINDFINSDSLKADLEKLGTFFNRNTASDTVSPTRGIGAARRWVYQKFQQFSTSNSGHLLSSYLQFDTTICTMRRHRDVFAVLPGTDTSDHSIIIIESHLDSRCVDNCDTSCLAEGIDDNGSGTALVIELARVLSKYNFKHTIVFLANIGEEQGLFGSTAFVNYAQQKSIDIKAVLNNDIVGGVLCGHTSSPPSCSPFGDIDSTELRVFSYGGFNSLHKGLARYIKLQYQERLLPIAKVPMLISLMAAEDRTGRGGDHIPFRQRGYTAIRFTSANENGNANVTDPGYIDNQHTSRDVLGYDTNSDGSLDSFLVDVHYLARNAQINAEAAAIAAISPKTPDFDLSLNGNQFNITIHSAESYPKYDIGVRTLSYDFDSVYTIYGTTGTVTTPGSAIYYVSVASVDSDGVESLFSGEKMEHITGIHDPYSGKGIYLMPAKPNPADEAATISVVVEKTITYHEAAIVVMDSNGNVIKRFPIELKKGINEVLFHHGYNPSGSYVYQLVIDGNIADAKKMIFSR
ncbi:MAG: M28 family peptidase [Chitinophagales bacterium]|nr:M28 family peptidase [Chitinophagales bacterium]